jgi:hypothetical protein
MAKIFIRERRHVSEGDGRPRFAVVGVQGSDVKFFKTRVRKAEIDAIAESIGAEVVMLPHGGGEHGNDGQQEGGGHGRGGRRRRRRDA